MITLVCVNAISKDGKELISGSVVSEKWDEIPVDEEIEEIMNKACLTLSTQQNMGDVKIKKTWFKPQQIMGDPSSTASMFLGSFTGKNFIYAVMAVFNSEFGGFYMQRGELK